MSLEFDIDKLREEVNPVYSTAQSCMQIVAAMGDEDSDRLRETLGFSVFGADAGERAVNIPPQIYEALMAAMPVYNSLAESRFFASNNFIKESGVKQVMDLPCGYTARGIKLADSGIRYFGMDLPAVIDAMDPAVKKVIGDNGNIGYSAVDATNYSSLRKALEGAEGELHITTEGMLMYFTQAEIETVFANIRKILLEFGGRWVTLDNELMKAEKLGLRIVTSDLPGELAEKVGSLVAGVVAKTTLSNNVFFDPDVEKAKKFVSDMGFDLELVPMSRYAPEDLAALKDVPQEKKDELIRTLDKVNYWVMTPKQGISENFASEEGNFKAEVELRDGTLDVKLEGRLDTITAPDLLALYKDAEARGEITRVCVDMKDLEYISSAGLRVLMIMRKKVAGNEDFTLLNMSDLVREIIETTGFDTIFC